VGRLQAALCCTSLKKSQIFQWLRAASALARVSLDA
jgi:hypothetical protein